ncbi:hypothetical protein ACHAXS_000232 [Conticribra weissflogii]
MIVFALVFGWCLCQVDFVLAYTQAPIDMDMDIELPDEIEPKGGSKAIHVLKLLSNLYKQNQAGWVWNQYLVDKPVNAVFLQSMITVSSTMDLSSSLFMWMMALFWDAQTSS